MKQSLGLGRNIVVLGLTDLLLNSFSLIWTPFLPIYLERQGVEAPFIATLFTVILLATTFAGIPGGILADKLGRKSTIVFARFLISLSYLFLGLSQLWMITVVSFVAYYMVSSISRPSITAMIGETSSEAQRATSFGSYHFLTSVGSILAPLAGGILLGFELFQLVFLMSAFGAIISASIGLIFLVETKKSTMKEQAVRKENKGIHILFSLNKALLLFMIAVIGFSLSGGLIYPFSALFSSDVFNFSELEFGIMISGGELVSFFANIPLGKIADRTGKRKALMISWAGTSILTGFWVFSPNFLVALSNYMISTLFFQLSIIAYESFITTIAPEKTRGSVIGLFETVIGLAMAGGPILGGYLWTMSPFFPFLACGIAGVTSACMLLLVKFS